MSAYRIKQYPLEQGALEIQYMEEHFGEFESKKTALEIIERLQGRDYLILIAEAPLQEDPASFLPVAFKVSHELRPVESDPKLKDLVARLGSVVLFPGRRVLYSWIGGTRRDWRGQGHFRALTEQQEAWAVEREYDEIIAKTKNRYYGMRGTLDRLRFDVIKFERHDWDNLESKLYLSKKLSLETIKLHFSDRTVVHAGNGR